MFMQNQATYTLQGLLASLNNNYLLPTAYIRHFKISLSGCTYELPDL